jgi:hypothetical protein
MKLLLLNLVLSFALISCNSQNEKPKVEMMNVKDIQLGPVVHDTLSKEQLEKIAKIHSTLAEVNRASLEETITNFKRDQNPDREIQIWQNIASAYEMFIKKHASLDLVKKDEAFKLLLLRSMMPASDAIEAAKLKVLNKAEVTELLTYYNAEPEKISIDKN